MVPAETVVIIGGGFSGTLTAVQLARQTERPLSIYLINTGYPVTKGVAYSAESDIHLLNVRAGRMSAIAQEPLHFRRWLETQENIEQYCQPGEALADAFIPRRIYGRYISEVFKECLESLPAYVKLEVIEAEVHDIEAAGDKYSVLTNSGFTIEAARIVLALGNFEPPFVNGLTPEAAKSSLYVNNPWRSSATTGLKKADTVLLIGTGLTMVDSVLSLQEQGFSGRIIALSRNARLPVINRKNNPYPEISEELTPPFRLNKIYAAVKKHIKLAVRSGSNCEALIDGMRPQTQEIWQGLPDADRARFLRHLSSLWSIFRHRMAPQVADKISALQESGQLILLSGRLEEISIKENTLIAACRLRNTKDTVYLPVQKLINCTGPQMNFSKIRHPFVLNLINRKFIFPEKLGLGVMAFRDGRLKDDSGQVIPGFFAIGPALRGVLWECTAVPEISEQAEKLAQTVLQSFQPELNVKVNEASPEPMP